MNLLDFIFPKRCVNCGKIGRYFCDVCREKIRVIAANDNVCPMCGRPALDGATHPRCRTRYGIDGLTSYFHYGGVIQKAIKVLKYRFVSDLAHEFVSLIPKFPMPQGVLVPIPLHGSRLRYRGFNQAEILAHQLNLPVRTDILRRTKGTPPQAELEKREDRLKNMTGVFEARHAPARVLLFDDVFTTGATMRSAARALKHAGATFVWAVTMAR